MRRLALTTDSAAAARITGAGLADAAVSLERRLLSGKPPSEADRAAFFAARSAAQDAPHWLDHTPAWRVDQYHAGDCGLVEFIARFEQVALWIEPDPNALLTLAWLLDYLRSHRSGSSGLTLFDVDSAIAGLTPEQLAESRLPATKVGHDQIALATETWQAYCAPEPTAWFDLLAGDLKALPRLRQTVEALLEELPGRATGLGATEVRMLELISEGNAGPFDVFPGDKRRNQRRAFGYWEAGALLDGLARCPAPVVSGLDEGPFTLEMHDDRDRYARYRRSRLGLTPLGKVVLAEAEDFSRHNPIRRWWGGTELTNDRLWRWDPANRALIAPHAAGS
jgi:hypothetical protein